MTLQTSTQPYELDITGAATAIAAGELSPTELTQSVLARVEALDGAIGAYRVVDAEGALAAAKAATEEIATSGPRGLLHGIPLGMKDLYATAGLPNTGSSFVRDGETPEADCAVMESLRGAGMVLIGKTETHEFAFGGITPTTRNPWNLGHIPGGSSGGSGAAVAAGMCAVGMGSDTGGSIRIPAAVCGTVGIKPTYGRVSRRGVLSLSWSLDHVGPLTRTVRDSALVLAATAGYDRADPATVAVPVGDYVAASDRGTAGSVAGLKVGIPTNYFTEGVDGEVAAATSAMASSLAGLGVELVPVEIPHPDLVLGLMWSICIPEASAYHQGHLRSRGDLYSPDVRTFLEVGELVLATDYIRALRGRTLLQQAFAAMFGGVDAVLAPTLPCPVPAVGQDDYVRPDGTVEPVIEALVRFNAPANLTGVPAISVTAGFTGTGLPIGVQLMGRPFDEETLFTLAAAYEASAPAMGRIAPDPA